jgi:hypothetical protein
MHTAGALFEYHSSEHFSFTSNISLKKYPLKHGASTHNPQQKRTISAYGVVTQKSSAVTKLL